MWKDFGQEKFGIICEPVLCAIRQVCADCGKGAFVETDGLKSNMQEAMWNPLSIGEEARDSIHFSRRSCYLLGERYFDAFCDCLQ